MGIKSLKAIKLKLLPIGARQVSQMSEAGHVGPRGDGGISNSLDLREHDPHSAQTMFAK